MTVAKSAMNFLMVVGFVSKDNSMTGTDLSDFLVSSVQDPLSRVDGVGEVQVFGAQYAMRMWIDPAKLTNYRLTPGDVRTALMAQKPGVGRPARRHAGGARPGLHRHHHRPEPPADRRRVRGHPAAQQHDRVARCA